MSIVLPTIGSGSLTSRLHDRWRNTRPKKASSEPAYQPTHKREGFPVERPTFSSDDDEPEAKGNGRSTEMQISVLQSMIQAASESLQSRQSSVVISITEAEKKQRKGSFKQLTVPKPANSRPVSPPILKYQKKQRLGFGASGTVWKGEFNSMTVAIKEIYLDISDLQYDYRMRKILEEFKAHKRLEHPYIVKFYEGEIQRDLIVFITEYMQNGSLCQYLRLNGPLDEPMVRQTIYQVIAGLAYVHSEGFIHRDIKAANILISNDNQSVKITDFGVAASKQDNSNFTNSKCLNGSHHWMAPEFFLEEKYDCKVDTWAVGCLLIELITSKVPFIDSIRDVFGMINMFHRLEKGEYHPLDDPLFDLNGKEIVLTPDLKSFLHSLLEFDPNKRPSCSEIIENLDDYPWLQENFFLSSDSNDSHCATHFTESTYRDPEITQVIEERAALSSTPRRSATHLVPLSQRGRPSAVKAEQPKDELVDPDFDPMKTVK